jgi:CRISPR-associated endonuclease/helicase Cas3
LQEGKFYCDRAFAKQNIINFAPGYSPESSDFLPEKLSTRLAEESVSLWLAKIVDGAVKPYAPGEHAWEMSALRVRQGWWENTGGILLCLTVSDSGSGALSNIRIRSLP